MGQQAGNVQQGMMAMGNTLSGGNGLEYLAREAENRKRIEQAGADRVLRNYQLRQAQEREDVNNVRNNYQRQQDMTARAVQFDKEYEQRERAQQHGMGIDTQKLALSQRAQNFEQLFGSQKLALEATKALQDNQLGLGKLNEDMRQFGISSDLATRKLQEVDIPLAKRQKEITITLARLADADPVTYAKAKEAARMQFGSKYTDEDVIAIMSAMKGGTPIAKPTTMETLGDPNAQFFPALRGLQPPRGN